MLIQFYSHLKNHSLKFLPFFSFVILLSSCAPSKRFTEYKETSIKDYKNEIRVLLGDSPTEIKTGSDVYLISQNEKLAIIKSGNKISIEPLYQDLLIKLGSKNFNGKDFNLEPVSDSLIKVNNKRYRGKIKLMNVDGKIKQINQLSLEDYLKGVMTKEMPVGKGNENFEAFKAFAIAARTYALNKIFNSRTYYDLLPDVNDQVYGGVDAEHPISNKAVDETKGLILTFKDEPAIIFYHSTCAGFTENAKNVFTKDEIEYLKSIKDGETPYCSISPNFNWKEVIPEKTLIKRLFDAKLLKSENYSIEKFNIKSRFSSGRINELEIILKSVDGLSSVSIFGNQIRSIIKNQSGNGILKSNNFIIELTPEKNVEIIGKGYGHGVGLCQWGAIAQSRSGKSYQEILSHYFPGTEIKKLND
ncbi:SpoIID/LytB domain-containing protein [Ignavibacterium album]|uniref:SpoIID/LytB domain-containing protein n=1 Tax=Ignavibacterium album TaxID=591197 RepID=UPI0011D244B6|nr:SpoIID/LytB domain-containing protein [Ignavibacterium album]